MYFCLPFIYSGCCFWMQIYIALGFVISAILMVCITKVAKASLEKALAENDVVEGILGSPGLPVVAEPPLDLQKPLIIKIDPSGGAHFK
ncbi:unnamed protein product [Ilex paraguariensis]|uniref:Uncharacterized protein n=1 Tax=Ilex paraguariensis TaxID=185542 RepID=A0ABC8S1F0_9AQUA